MRKKEAEQPYPPLKKVVKARGENALKKLIKSNQEREWKVVSDIQPFGTGVAVLMMLEKKGVKRQ